MANVALLGTGLIGSGMVEGMLRRGDRVTVWNRTPSKAKALEAHGARAAATVAEAVAGAERVHIVLSDDASVDGVLAQFPDRLSAVVIDHTTVTPQGTIERFSRCEKRGLAFLHAPIFMSPAGARASQGVIMVAGPKARFESVQPALAAMTGTLWYVGERADLAAAYKLFGNAMILTITAGLSDVFRLARTLGIDPKEAHALFGKFDPSMTIAGRGKKMAEGDYTASFETTMARKDLRLMMETCDQLQIVPAIAQLLDRAIAEGHGQEDVGVIAEIAKGSR